jgi:L-threonylcarbamoyladenylate synthase
MIIRQGEAANLHAAEIVKRGGVIGYRTDTFYGLGANPENAAAVHKIVKLKGREDGKPILLLISDRDIVPTYLNKTSKAFETLSNRFWPGPLTLIGAARNTVSSDLTAGTGTLGVRLPDDAGVRQLVRACGGALTATSANPAGMAPALSASEVEDYFRELDLIIDGGVVRTSEPSTVLDVTGSKPKIIREGAIKRTALGLI